MSRDTGGPAFPIMDSQTVHRVGAVACEGLTDPAEKDKVYLAATVAAASGMTLRDYFAGQALAGISAHPVGPAKDLGETSRQANARWAYSVADAMLVERAK